MRHGYAMRLGLIGTLIVLALNIVVPSFMGPWPMSPTWLPGAIVIGVPLIQLWILWLTHRHPAWRWVAGVIGVLWTVGALVLNGTAWLYVPSGVYWIAAAHWAPAQPGVPAMRLDKAMRLGLAGTLLALVLDIFVFSVVVPRQSLQWRSFSLQSAIVIGVPVIQAWFLWWSHRDPALRWLAGIVAVLWTVGALFLTGTAWLYVPSGGLWVAAVIASRQDPRDG